ATESNGGASAATVASLAVKVTGVADAPTLSVTDTHGPAGSPIALGIAAALTDTDGSETLGIQIANVPTGATLSSGVNAGNGIWVLTPAQLAGLTITPPAGSTTGFALSVVAVSTEDNGTTATTTHSLNVAIDGTTTTQAPPPPPAGVIVPDAVPQPQHPGDIVGVRFENNTDTAEAARTVTFGQVFAKGDLPAGAQLVALVNGQQ